MENYTYFYCNPERKMGKLEEENYMLKRGRLQTVQNATDLNNSKYRTSKMQANEIYIEPKHYSAL